MDRLKLRKVLEVIDNEGEKVRFYVELSQDRKAFMLYFVGGAPMSNEEIYSLIEVYLDEGKKFGRRPKGLV